QAAETSAAPVSLGSDLPDEADTAATDSDDADVRAALDAAAPKVDDPFMQRLKSRDGWSPTPLPVPSYVDAPEAEHPAPSATAADASSYETEARSREDIAAQFAAELGYRPELSASARGAGPPEHGRRARRTTKAADLGAVNDVLARRRACAPSSGPKSGPVSGGDSPICDQGLGAEPELSVVGRAVGRIGRIGEDRPRDRRGGQD